MKARNRTKQEPSHPDPTNSPPPKPSSTSPRLLTWSELPLWMQDNAYILSAYRPQSNSYQRSFQSLLYLHNESINIWTHALGCAGTILIGSVLLSRWRGWESSGSRITTQVPGAAPSIPQRKATLTAPEMADLLVFACFFVGAAGCLAASATYHTISNHSPTVARLGNWIDYVGIVALIWGSFVPSIYYGWMGHEQQWWWRRVYWGMISSIAAAILVVVLMPRFRSPAWRPVRAALFVAMGLSAVLPVAHGWSVYGAAQLDRQMGLSWLLLQGALYISGAAIYAARIPERWRPGRFDVWGSSHQIFHVLVVLAASAHLVGLLRAFAYAHSV